MIFNRLVVSFLLLAILAPPVASAQETANPRISIVHPSADLLKRDLKNLLSLTPPREKAQYATLEDLLDTFSGGVKTSAPVRIDLLVGATATRLLWGVPLESIGEFRKNISLLGLESRQRSGMFQLYDAADGWMMEAVDSRTKQKRAVLGELKSDLKQMLTDNVSPRLVKTGDDFAAELANQETDAASRAARRKSFATIRKEMAAAVKRKRTESVAQFAVRQQTMENQLLELERLFVQAQRIQAGWKFDTSKKSGRFHLELKPIPETDLAKTVSEFEENASRFAAVPKAANSVFSLRINHPIDDLRKKYLSTFFDKNAALAAEQIDARKISGAEKTASKKIAQGIAELLKDGANGGMMNSFIEAVPSGSQYTIVGGVVTSRDMSADVKGLAAMLPTARKGQDFQPDVAKLGDIAVHKVKVLPPHPEVYNQFLGKDPYVLLAAGPDTLWFGAGPNAMAALKKAVEQSPKDAAKKTRVLDLYAKLGPGMKLLDLIRAKQPPGKTREERTAIKERREIREMALESFAKGDDVLTLQADRADDSLNLVMQAGKGVMTFVGRQIATFAETLAVE